MARLFQGAARGRVSGGSPRLLCRFWRTLNARLVESGGAQGPLPRPALARAGIQRRHSPFGAGSREFLAGVDPRDPRRQVDSMLGLIDDFDREVETATREIDALAKADERVDVLTQSRPSRRCS